jgi:hypothetical protein
MKQLDETTIKEIKKNIKIFFNLASEDNIKQGLSWYTRAYIEAKEISKRYGYDTYKVAQVISALSPRNKWEQNLKDADKVCEAHKEGIHPTDIKVCTFHSNKFKAFNILSNNVDITEKSLKTYNFVQNIAYLSRDHVTVDIWHLRACFKDKIKINNASIGKIAYGQIKDATLEVAKEIGIKGFELQAIVWLSAQSYFSKTTN